MSENDQRSIQQNASIHKLFDLLEDECTALGLTMDMLIKEPTEVPITKALLKDFFRLIGLKMYGKKSTSDLTRKEIDMVIKVFEKAIGERLKLYIPFPSIDNLLREQDENNLEGESN